MKNLLEKLAKNGGKIVSTAECSALQIAQAQACDRMHIDEHGFGFIYFPPQKGSENSSTIPRRNQLNLNVPAELAITNAIQEIEKLPASTILTDAVVLLTEAKNKVSDFIDNQ